LKENTENYWPISLICVCSKVQGLKWIDCTVNIDRNKMPIDRNKFGN